MGIRFQQSSRAADAAPQARNRFAPKLALVLDRERPVNSFKVKALPVSRNAHVWECPPIGLEVNAVRFRNWRFEKPIDALIPNRSTDIPEPPVPKRPFKDVGRPEKITLVPFGFTILRMAHLPVIYSGELAGK